MWPCLKGKGGIEPVGHNPGEKEMRGSELGREPKPPSRPRTPRRGKGEAEGMGPLPYPVLRVIDTPAIYPCSIGLFRLMAFQSALVRWPSNLQFYGYVFPFLECVLLPVLLSSWAYRSNQSFIRWIATWWLKRLNSWMHLNVFNIVIVKSKIPLKSINIIVNNNNNICHLADAFIQSDLQSCVHTFLHQLVG
jgi:hypothetical protein